MTTTPEVTESSPAPLLAIRFPDHAFAPDDYGHNCTGCTTESPWKCDKVAHALGETESGLKLLYAVR